MKLAVHRMLCTNEYNYKESRVQTHSSFDLKSENDVQTIIL